MFAGLARLAARAGATAPTAGSMATSLPGAVHCVAGEGAAVRIAVAASPTTRTFSATGPRMDERQRAVDFCLKAGYDPAIAEGIVDTLLAPGSGITKVTLRCPLLTASPV